MIKLATWNVNGIRAACRKGFLDWLAEESPDILGIQEIKATEEQLDENILKPDGYQTFWFPAQRKGYSGTAVFFKKAPLNLERGLGIEEFDVEGRSITVEFEDFIFITAYYPNGKDDLSRVEYKLRFSESLKNRALELKAEKNKAVIICGDVNTAHEEIDLARPKANVKSTGFLPEERAWVSSFIESGFIDTFRHLNDEPNHYTWWSYRAGARRRNVGWRIDYFFVTPELSSRISKAYHRPEVMGSDHCPVILELEAS